MTVSHYWSVLRTCHVLWSWMVTVRPTIQAATLLLSSTCWLRGGWCCFSPWGDIFRNIASVFLHSQSVLHPSGARKHFHRTFDPLRTNWLWPPQTLLSNSCLGLPPTVWWLDLCCVWVFYTSWASAAKEGRSFSFPTKELSTEQQKVSQSSWRSKASHASLDLHQPLKNKDWEGKRLGRKFCWLHSHRGSFIWDWKTLWRGTPFRNYYQMSPPSRCFWSVPVRSCARERECV